MTMQGSSYVGTVTLTTDADLIRISRSVGSLTGNSAGSEGEYYYLRSGDTISVTSTQSTFAITAESVSSQDEEAAFFNRHPGRGHSEGRHSAVRLACKIQSRAHRV